MPIETWWIYVATVIALMSTPGPSQLLMLSHAGGQGFSRALATAAGDLTANALQMLAAGVGLAAILTASNTVLSAIKWVGVLYLLWLGIKMIRNTRASTLDSADQTRRQPLRRLWFQGFFTSAANPKAVVFFAALFPQFISAELAFWPQFLILSLTYLTLDGLFLSADGLTASWIAKTLRGPARLWIDRIGGGFMIGAAVLLSAKSLGDS